MAVTTNVEIVNNTFINNQATAGDGTELFSGGAGDTLNATMENNISVNAPGADFIESGSGTANITANNNLSSDATADDWGGASPVINIDADDEFVDQSSEDYELKPRASSRYAAKVQSTFADDCAGRDRNTQRGWHIGSMQTDSRRGYSRRTST